MFALLRLIPGRFLIYGGAGLFILLAIRWWTNSIAEKAAREGELKNETAHIDAVNTAVKEAQSVIDKTNAELQVHEFEVEQSRKEVLSERAKLAVERKRIESDSSRRQQENAMEAVSIPVSELDARIREELLKLRQSH